MNDKQVFHLIQAITNLSFDPWQSSLDNFCNKLKIHCEILKKGLSLVKINNYEYFISLGESGFSYYSNGGGIIDDKYELSLTELLNFIKEKAKSGKHN